mmetsp:Transcript_56503/g.112336  ORF Transcript_56503/g.112336 Transcript_56503/m.112336 type:complete len:87 (+) Transcript_56503:125-385(+)
MVFRALAIVPQEFTMAFKRFAQLAPFLYNLTQHRVGSKDHEAESKEQLTGNDKPLETANVRFACSVGILPVADEHENGQDPTRQGR